MGGYFKVWRKIEDSKSWSRGALYRGLMITLLQKANWKQGYFHGQEILPGQLACSGASLANELDLSRYQVMRMLATLEDDGFISRQTFGKVCTLITVVNWQLYQYATEEVAQQPHNGRTSGAQVPHTIEEGKKARKEIPSASADAAEEGASPAGKEKQEKTAPHTAPEQVVVAPEPSPSSGRTYRTATKRVLTGQRLAWFNRVWDAFGYKRNKAEAADVFIDIEGLSESLVAAICRAAEREAARRPDLMARGKTPKMLTGWLSGRRWEDEADAPPPLVPTAARGPLLGDPVMDMPTPEQREQGWKTGLSLMARWQRGATPDNIPGQFDRRKPLPIPANFGRVLQRAL
uniref:MarR family transcriptional regulator n=1 Tax=uncultured Bilophila sp. TaxID=529385 RepID=UPI0025FDDCBA|nr:MarR family transcriptional regulator [uncultured Bilophila sp.]